MSFLGKALRSMKRNLKIASPALALVEAKKKKRQKPAAEKAAEVAAFRRSVALRSEAGIKQAKLRKIARG